MLDQFHTHYEQ